VVSAGKGGIIVKVDGVAKSYTPDEIRLIGEGQHGKNGK
jgi:hypothetical protein